MSLHAIDKRPVKIALRVLGIPITIIAVLGLIDGIGILLGGIEQRNPWSCAFGLGALLSFAGLIGAWKRISVQYADIDPDEIGFIRLLLKIGVAGAILLSAGALGIFGFDLLPIPAFFTLLALTGVYFIHETPKSF